MDIGNKEVATVSVVFFICVLLGGVGAWTPHMLYGEWPQGEWSIGLTTHCFRDFCENNPGEGVTAYIPIVIVAVGGVLLFGAGVSGLCGLKDKDHRAVAINIVKPGSIAGVFVIFGTSFFVGTKLPDLGGRLGYSFILLIISGGTSLLASVVLLYRSSKMPTISNDQDSGIELRVRRNQAGTMVRFVPVSLPNRYSPNLPQSQPQPPPPPPPPQYRSPPEIVVIES